MEATKPLAVTVPVPNPDDNPNTAPAEEEETTRANDNGGDDDDDPECPEMVENLLARVGHIDALCESAQYLINAVPRIGDAKGERAFSRVARVIEQLSGFASAALQYAEYADDVLRRRYGNGGNGGAQGDA